jgi:addiction module RelE/StbE family toxin
MASGVILEWSVEALADLDRFAKFLHQEHPRLAAIVAEEIITKAASLVEHPLMGQPIAGHGEYRQVVLRVLNADYVFQYHVGEGRLTMLRVFHGRERR